MKLSKKTKLIILIAAILLVVSLFSRCSDGNDPLPTDGGTMQDVLTLLTEPPETDAPEPAEASDAEGEDETADPPLLLLGEATPLPEAEAAEEPTSETTAAPKQTPAPATIDRDGTYTKKDDVALYIRTYGELPKNFITKNRARELGWSGGGLDDFAYGCSIGGDRFGNYEGLLPEKKGRTYYECDIGTMNRSSRGAKRIVYSNDGLIYYTDDHYESFTLLYGDE